MILNTEEIYANLDSLRKKKGYSQDKMAELIGMGGKSAYSKMLKLKSMKLEYLVNLLNNTDITFEQLSGLSSKYKPVETKVDKVEEKTTVVTTFSCPDCISKQREIDALNKALDAKEELLEKYRADVKKETGSSRVAPTG